MNRSLELTSEEYILVRKFRRLDDDARERAGDYIDAALVSQTAKRRDPATRERFEAVEMMFSAGA
ncbi:MAG: hypothetical protein ACP5FP_04415 [Desulfuromonadaceae bacterium]|jgi:hypothetical protein